MRIVVFGAGAVGSLIGGALSRAHDVTLVGRAAHMAAIQASGLRIEAQPPFTARPATTTTAAGQAPADIVLLTVKAYDTAAALRQLAPLMGPRTILVSVQNGLGNWEQARSAYPQHAVLASSVLVGAMLVGPGAVRWSGGQELTIGGDPKDAAAVEQTRLAVAAGGIKVHTTDNIAGALWMKAIINAAINPLTALHRVPNGALLQDPTLRATMRRVTEEAAAVARAERVRLPASDPAVEVERIAHLTAANRSSMLQSVEKGLPTEIDAITGAILQAAARHGIPCPENQRLYRAVNDLGLAAVR